MSGVIAVIVDAVMRIILGARSRAPAWIVLALTPTVAASSGSFDRRFGRILRRFRRG